MFLCWGGCTSGRYIKLQTHKATVGQLDDVIAQRLYAVASSLSDLNYNDYVKNAEAKKEVLLTIIGGSTTAKALEIGGVEPEGVASTNSAVEAIIALGE